MTNIDTLRSEYEVARIIMENRTDSPRCLVKNWEAEERDNPHVEEAVRQARAVLAALGPTDMLRSAVELAEKTFRAYGDLHDAKPDPVKAERNYALADQMRTALGPTDAQVYEWALLNGWKLFPANEPWGFTVALSPDGERMVSAPTAIEALRNAMKGATQ